MRGVSRRAREQGETMRFSRLAAVAGASVLVLGIASCSSHRGQARGIERRRRGRRNRRHAAHDGRDDHPRGARRLVLGSDPQGCRGRGQEGQHRAALLQRPRGAQPGQPGADRRRQRREGHRRDAGQARRDGAAVKAAEAKGIPVVAFNSGFDDWQAMGVKEYFGQDELRRGPGRRRAAERPTAPRRSSASSRSRARLPSKPAAPA